MRHAIFEGPDKVNPCVRLSPIFRLSPCNYSDFPCRSSRPLVAKPQFTEDSRTSPCIPLLDQAEVWSLALRRLHGMHGSGRSVSRETSTSNNRLPWNSRPRRAKTSVIEKLP